VNQELLTIHVPLVNQELLTIQVALVNQELLTIQLPLVNQELLTIQVPLVNQELLTIQVPLVNQELLTIQVPLVNQELLTIQVPRVNQELLTIQEHLNSPSIVVGSCCTMFNLLCIVLGSLLVPFPLIVVMSVIRYAASDCLWELHTFLIAEFEAKDRACSVSVFV
jgi:hypothetical protein